MRTYEAVFVLDPKKVEDGGDGFAKATGELIESLGGKVQRVQSLGRKQFARQVGKHRAGVYWDMIIDLDPANVAVLKDRYRLNATVLRVEVFEYEEPPAGATRATVDRRSSFDSFRHSSDG